MNQVDAILAVKGWKQELIHWCVQRQIGGMQGRPNKNEDTCYSYWIGGTLRILGMDHLLDQHALRDYIMTCQSPYGGFGKVIGAPPDMLHSFYSLAWLSLSNTTSIHHHSSNNNNIQEEETIDVPILPLQELSCTLGIRQSRAELFHVGDEPRLP